MEESDKSSDIEERTPQPEIAGQNLYINQKYKIYCDLDGVLANFDEGVRRLSGGYGPKDLTKKQMWKAISRCEDFYENLPWMDDGKELWAALIPLQPDILTGVSMTYSSRAQKASWCRRELPSVIAGGKYSSLDGINLVISHVDVAGTSKTRDHEIVKGSRLEKKNLCFPEVEGPKEIAVNVLTCWSKNKHFESGTNCILIDDRWDMRETWIAKGGIFIHHINTATTLQILSDLGIMIR